MEESHLKVKNINMLLKTVQSWKEHLKKYKKVPKLGNGNGIIKPYNFQIDLKEEAPLYLKYGVKAVSVSFLPEKRTLEILLLEQEGRKDDMPFTNEKYFDSVGELMVALDKIADGDVEDGKVED